MSIEQSVFKLQRLVRFSSVGVGTAIRALNTGCIPSVYICYPYKMRILLQLFGW